MRTLLTVLLASASLLAGGAQAASTEGDDDRARALVVGRADVPARWDASIVLNPCPSTSRPAARGATRAATRWGGTGAGIWSVAFVARSSARARALYDEIATALPGCVARFWRAHALPPGQRRTTVVVTRERFASLAGEHRRWTVTVRDRTGVAAPFAVDVIVARRGRAVAQYVVGWSDGLDAVRRALARS